MGDPEILEAITQSPKTIRPLRLNNADTIMRVDSPTIEQRSFCEKFLGLIILYLVFQSSFPNALKR